MAVGLATFWNARSSPLWRAPWTTRQYQLHHVTERRQHLTYLFIEDILPTDILPRTQSCPTHKTRPNVADYVAIEIGHHHHIKLIRVGHQLWCRSRVSVCMCVCVRGVCVCALWRDLSTLSLNMRVSTMDRWMQHWVRKRSMVEKLTDRNLDLEEMIEQMTETVTDLVRSYALNELLVDE